jgi:hypothetical protein
MDYENILKACKRIKADSTTIHGFRGMTAEQLANEFMGVFSISPMVDAITISVSYMDGLGENQTGKVTLYRDGNMKFSRR